MAELKKQVWYVNWCPLCGKFMTDEANPLCYSDDMHRAWIVEEKDRKYLQLGLKGLPPCCAYAEMHENKIGFV